MWWLKKFRKRKMQSILIVAVIMLCTMLIAGSAVILSSLTSVYEGLADETHAPDVKVYARGGFSEKDYQSALEKTGLVENVIQINKVSYPTAFVDGEKKDAFLDVCEYEKEVYQDVRVISGNLNQITDTKCALSQALANSLEVKVGDSIQVQSEGVMYEYEIVATFAEIYSAATQYTCDLLVKELPEDIKSTSVFAVYLKSDATCDQLIQQYTKDNDGILDGYFRSKADCVINAELTELILGGILLGISSVVFLAILLIIGYIIKNCFRLDKKTIAVYKTIGYSNHQIRKIYITFYMSLIFTGSILGSLCSPVLSNTFIEDVYRDIGEKGNVHGLWQILACILLINGVSLLILFLETRRIGKMKPVEILSGSDEAIGKKKQKNSKRERLSFSPISMALRMIGRDKKNTILLLITCVISIYIVNLSVVCLENLDLIKGDTNYYWLGIDKHDVTIENNGISDEQFYQICDEIQEKQNVKKVVKRNYDGGFAMPYHQTTSALIYETFDDLEVPVIEGRNPQYADEVVIGNIYKEELGIEVGDYITLQLDATHRKDLLVVGTYQGFYNMGRSVKVMGSLLEENDVTFSYLQCSISLDDRIAKNDDAKETFMNELEEEYGAQIKVVDRKNLYASIMDVICEPQKAAMQPFAIVAVLIGALNAFYIIYASNIEKRKKYTIYKSIGYSSKHLLAVNSCYVMLIVLVAVIIAVPAFLILFPKIMVMSMSSFGFAEYKLVVKPMTLIVTNAGMVLVFVVSSAVAGIDICKNYIAQIMD